MKNKLWTRDFTIITLGSMVSLFGNTLSAFAMDLMVLDRTESTALFALYQILYTVPMILAPVIAGPFLDRFSRRKTIYTLDFISASLFALMALYQSFLPFNFIFYASMNILLGSIGGVYSVAYQSFYPLTITEGNYQKAYAVDSTLETLAAFMTPVSALIYNTLGLVPLFWANASMYFIAALMETLIRTEEKYTERESEYSGLRRFTEDFREGVRYLRGEKGLSRITAYFFFSSFVGGVSSVVLIPWFRQTFENGEYIYSIVWLMSDLARVLSGLVFYKFKLPTHKKYAIAFSVYLLTGLIEAVYLFLPVPLMMAVCFIEGLFSMTSYNIRIAATQQYVPDEKKGRFNGAFGTLTTIGQLTGQGCAGVFGLFIAARPLYVAAQLVCIGAAVILIGGGKSSVSAVYNIEN